MTTATSMTTIKTLRILFSRYGVPKMIVSDNGPQFTSEEFQQFCNNNNVKHVRSTPYHPKTNGLVERAVQTFKNRFQASKSVQDLDLRLANFLFSYRNTPHATTGRSPAELFMGRRLRTPLDLLKPDVSVNVETKLQKQKMYHDRNTRYRAFSENEDVWVQMPSGQNKDGRIIKRTGEYSYIVDIAGTQRRKHADQLRLNKNQSESLEFSHTASEEQSREERQPATPPVEKLEQIDNKTPMEVQENAPNEPPAPLEIEPPTTPDNHGVHFPRRSTRQTKPISRYEDSLYVKRQK